MALDLSSLTKYVDEQRLPLISKLGADAKTAKEFQLQTGVKNEAALNLLEVSADFADGHACGSFGTGSTATFSQRNLKVGSVKVELGICQNAMQEYWMNHEVQVAAGRKNLPFEEEICNKLVDDVNDKVEKLLWQGTGSSDIIEGLDSILTATTGAAGGVNVASAATSATMYDKVIAVYNAIPEKSLGKAVIYLSKSAFRSLVQEMIAKNLYHYSPEQNSNFE